MSQRYLVTALLVAILAGVLGALGLTGSGAPTRNAGTPLDPPRPLAAFELIDQAGRPFTHRDLEGRWSLLFAGFTHCPDICPDTLVRLDALDERLRETGVELETVFLSLDPERDTPARLADYLAYFNPEFTGVTGKKEEIDKLTDALGLAYVKIPGSEGRYTVDHSSAVVLIDPKGRAAAYFRAPLDIDALTADLGPMIKAKR